MKTMTKMTKGRAALGLAAAALVLTACGGGGGGESSSGDPLVAGSDVPQSATTSSAGAIAFMKSLAAVSDNTATPIVVGDAVLATSDTDDPDPGV